MPEFEELKPEALYRKCDPASLGFTSTTEIENTVNLVGQERASNAIDFGMNISHPGYNIFVLGPTGAGKKEIIQEFFQEKAKSDPTPPDWIYVNDFDNPDEPEAIRMPPGMGVQYQKDVNEFTEEMRTALSAAFESEEYQNRRQAIFESFKEKQSELFNNLQEEANKQDLTMIKTPSGVAFAPTDEDGTLSAEEVNQLSEEKRDEIKKNIKDLQEELQKILQQVPTWQREAKEEIKALNKEMANFAIGGLINELLEKYKEYDEIVEHIKQIQDQVVENADELLPSNGGEPNSFLEAIQQRRGGESLMMEKFKVNVIV
ncbi:MAG: Lon-like protease helical domain-containing protein, partial [Chloroflexota bacterium]|nr:Lon-like protease helical domain-containing protein [Chloroflexota bacterium]